MHLLLYLPLIRGYLNPGQIRRFLGPKYI